MDERAMRCIASKRRQAPTRERTRNGRQAGRRFWRCPQLLPDWPRRGQEGSTGRGGMGEGEQGDGKKKEVCKTGLGAVAGRARPQGKVGMG